ncbi:MAG TPA: HNH endonuclease [Terriglobales bacterium]|nr:HNH endonuclease [Terriglobales bacterium]
MREWCARLNAERATAEGWARLRSLRSVIDATPQEVLALLWRQGLRCAVTGRVLDFSLPNKHPLQPTIDHICPKSEGGPNTINNLRVVIWAVNAARGGSSKYDAVITSLFVDLPARVSQ